MKFQIVENWRKLWKSDVLQCLAAALVVPELWEHLAKVVELVPAPTDTTKLIVTQVFITIGAVLRYRKQPELSAK